jgi:Putative beta barrel porin-7 (BBP7)
MRTLLLSSLSILGGLTTVHAQHWVPYSFHAYKHSSKKAEQVQAPAAEKSAESRAPVAVQQLPASQQQPVATQAPAIQSPAAVAVEQQAVAAQEPAPAAQSVVEPLQADDVIASNAELDAFFTLDSQTAYNDPSVFYSDPDRDYGKPKPLHPAEKAPRRWRLCTENWWVEGDYMIAWLKKGHINSPLITTGVPGPSAGVIGQPGTSVVFGKENYDFSHTSGVRGAIGGYLGLERHFAFDIDGFYVFTRTKSTTVMSDATGSPIIARPFFDVRTGFENAERVSNPGFYTGTSRGTIKTNFWGAEANIGYHPCSDPINRCTNKIPPVTGSPCKNMMTGDLFIGARYLHLFEKISVKDEMTPIATPSGLSFNGAAHPIDPPDMLRDKDTYRANNDFWGGQVGIRGDFAWNAWFSMGVMGKVAFGVTEQRYKTEGETIWSSAGFGRQFASGGVLVQPNNQVHRTRWKFGWVPEINANIGVELLEHLRFTVGYSILWWNKVVRVGTQIDRDVNSGQIPRDPSFYTPAVQAPDDHLKEQGFWMRSVNFGVCFDF